MNDDQKRFFTTLVETTGPSGYEESTQQVWRERVGQAAETQTDLLGNTIAVINPNGSPRVVLEAHIDEIGVQVRYIDENGFLYFNTLGGFDPATLPGTRVRLMGRDGPVDGVIGRKPMHVLTEDERKLNPKIEDMWIDIGVRNREEAQTVVRIGDAGGRAQGVAALLGNFLVANSLDDRAGAYVVAEAFLALARAQPRAAVYALSAVQEEVGLRGAGPAAYGIDAPIGVAVDVTYTSDHPETRVERTGEIRCARGPVMSRGPATSPRVFDRLEAAAESEGIAYQLDADPRGSGTDQYVLQVTRSGMATGLVSIPTRYLHTASEIVSTDDLDAAVALLTRFVLDLDDEVRLTP
jgi:endoglucanase